MVRAILFEGFRFAIVGVAATFTHLSIALAVLALGATALAANLIGFVGALGASIIGHHLFSFPGRVPFFYGAIRFIFGAVLAFAVNCTVLVVLTRSGPAFSPWIRLTIAIVVMPIVTFVYSRSFAYR